MNHEIQTMLTACEGRYPTRAEQAMLRDWASRLDARLAAVEEIHTREESIVSTTVDEVLRAYPDLEKRVKNARQCCMRDESLVLRYCTLAMLRGDPKYLEDALLTWMATVLRGIGFAPQFISDTYQTLIRIAARELSPPTMELLRPYLELSVTALAGKQDPGGAAA
jgi:hypothetical protein